MDNLFRNSLSPGLWALLALIPPAIFALYFLKLKRQPLEVPSTYLWHKVVEDLHVNSLWQRLRKSLLLLLQLLIIGLVLLALLRPGWQGQALDGQQFVFLLDNSASMAATDTKQGHSRLEQAKQRIAALIEQLEPGMSAMIITFADQPDVVQEFTTNKRILREALDRVAQQAGKTDLTGALELADGFANPNRVMDETAGQSFEVTKQENVELFIFSDGRFPSVESFSMGNLRPQFLPTGSFEAQNLAITAFNTRRNEERPELQQAFVQVANFSDAEQKVVVNLHLNGELFDAQELTILANRSKSATFNLGGEVEGQMQAELDIPAEFKDCLQLDNRAYTVLSRRSDGRVLLVTPGNTTLESALTTTRSDRLAKVEKVSPDVLKTEDFKDQLQAEVYDLVIFDQCKPDQMPQANTLFVGRMPPLADWKEQNKDKSKPVSAPQIIDWQRSHPLLSLLELGNVQIIDSLLAKPPLGGRVLVDSTQGPLISIAPRGRFEDVMLGFEIVGTDASGDVLFNTDWPRKHSFPGFWLNALDYFAGGANKSETTHQAGEMVEMRVTGATESIEVKLPDGQVRRVPLDQPGHLSFHETLQLGFYEVLPNQTQASKEGETSENSRFAVNLFGSDESDVRLRVRQDSKDGLQEVEALSIGYVDVSAQSPTSAVRRELWKPLLVGALLVLMLEWYIYNRRVYI